MNKAEQKQNEIFRKMSADQKVKLSSDLTSIVLKLYKLAKGNKKNFKILNTYFANDLIKRMGDNFLELRKIEKLWKKI